jgi:hypothetical protein
VVYLRRGPAAQLSGLPPAPQAVRPVKEWLRRPALQATGLAAGLTFVASLLGQVIRPVEGERPSDPACDSSGTVADRTHIGA